MINPVYLLSKLLTCISKTDSELYRKICIDIKTYKRSKISSFSSDADIACAQKISEEILKISDSPSEDVLYIFQHGFFNPTGEKFYSGGAERYMCDLSRIAIERNLKVILIQLGDSKRDVPWIKLKKGIHVIGVNGSVDCYASVIGLLPRPKFAIYSGFTFFGTRIFDNSLIISHGITWDVPYVNCNIQAIKDILDRHSTIVSVDTNTLSWLRSTFSYSLIKQPKKFKYIPNYVNLKEFSPAPKNESDKLKITFPRRLCPERGFDLFYSAAEEILARYDNVIVEFVGFVHTSDIQKQLDDLMSRFRDRVTHRLVSADDMPAVYQSTDIVVIPTKFAEGTSLSCLESLASGNCVISTNIGGLPNLIINDYNGILINPDREELVEALKRLIENHDFRTQLQTRACNSAKVFSKDKWEKAWRCLFDEVI